jgi:hypothetical protein
MRGYAVLAAALVSSLAASSANVRTPAAMCRSDARDGSALFPDAPEVIRVLNGKLIENSADAALKPDMIESIFVVCDAIHIFEEFGFKSKRGGVFIFTRPGPKTMLKASLDSIATLQKTHFAAHRKFADRLADLLWSDSSGLITIQLDVSPSGDRWIASGTHRYLVFFGSGDSVMTVSGSSRGAKEQ